MMITHISDFILFVVINIVNVSTFLLFVSRVKWPKLTRKLAILTVRQPRNLKILIPFLLLFYIGLGGMGVLTWRIGFTFWAITAVAFALQFGGMAYAHRHGKG